MQMEECQMEWTRIYNEESPSVTTVIELGEVDGRTDRRPERDDVPCVRMMCGTNRS